jgi:hypothetical protein
MDQKILFKQMIDFQKTTFDNSFSAMTALQEQGEKMVGMFLEQANWLPAEGKKAIRDWTDAYNKGRLEFKKNVETHFKKVEDYFNEGRS